MRFFDQLDALAKRHKIVATIVTGAIVFACLALANQIDKANDINLRWQMAANARGAT